MPHKHYPLGPGGFPSAAGGNGIKFASKIGRTGFPTRELGRALLNFFMITGKVLASNSIVLQLCFENSFVISRCQCQQDPINLIFSFLSLIKWPLIFWLKYILTESIAFRFISKIQYFLFQFFSLPVLDPRYTSLPGVYLYPHTAGLFNYQLP